MLKFTRTKLVSIYRKNGDTLTAQGILEDDIYGLELDVTLSLSNLEIISIEGGWKRAENRECVRAIPFLQEAVGVFGWMKGSPRRLKKLSVERPAVTLLKCSWNVAIPPGMRPG